MLATPIECIYIERKSGSRTQALQSDQVLENAYSLVVSSSLVIVGEKILNLYIQMYLVLKNDTFVRSVPLHWH